MSDESPESTPTRSRAGAPSAPVVAPAPPPVERLTLDEFVSREPRLERRPVMAHAFAQHCRRDGLARATTAEFAQRLTQFEGGSRS